MVCFEGTYHFAEAWGLTGQSDDPRLLEFVGLGLLGGHLLEWQTSLLLAIAKGRL